MAAQFIKHFLNILNDKVFISSIDYIDFKTRYISIRRDFFNLCFTMANTREQIYKPAAFALILKELFIVRFSQLSTNTLTSYMNGFVRNSFIDFLNVARYYTDIISINPNKEKFFKNYMNKRNFRFFEKKGKRYYVYCIKNTPLPFSSITKQDSSNDDSPYLAKHDYINNHENGDSDDDTDYNEDIYLDPELDYQNQQIQEPQQQQSSTNQLKIEEQQENSEDQLSEDRKVYEEMKFQFQSMGIFSFDDFIEFKERQEDDDIDDYESDHLDDDQFDSQLEISGTYQGELPDYLYDNEIRSEIYELNKQSQELTISKQSNFDETDEIRNYDTSQGFEKLDNIFKQSAVKNHRDKVILNNINDRINKASSSLFNSKFK